MRTFADNTGRSWTIVVNVDAIKRVRSLLGVNLLEIVDGDLIERLATDPVLLCDVLYAILKPEADAQQITDQDFGRAMAGDAIDLATTALLEELVDFFPQRKRRLLRGALAKLKAWEAKALEVVERRLESQELDAQFENALRNIGNSSGSLRASSESTPGR